MHKIRKAIFPVAGLGTRFLPATKTIPKEMLTIVDKPVIQYVVDEAHEAGIEQLIFVTGRNKAVIEDYFDTQIELYRTLERRNKKEELQKLQALQPSPGRAYFTRQQDPLGLGHAVWCARDLVGEEPFALLLPDMIMQAPRGCLKEMVELYQECGGGNIDSVEECSPDETHQYGIVEPGESVAQGFEIVEMVEKPEEGTAPSNLYMNGRYILQPEIFPILEDQKAGAGGEIQLTDAMRHLSMQQKFYGFCFKGQTFDCGSKKGFIEANVALALERVDMQKDMRLMLSQLFENHIQ